MSQTVEIYINNQLADFSKIEDLNLEFRKIIDDWLNFGGSIATTTNALANSITLPATANNTAILYDSNNNNAANLLAHALTLPIIIYLNGYILFVGDTYLGNVRYERGAAVNYNLSLVGQADKLFAAMDKPLNEINMGQTPSRAADIIASWTLISNTDNPVVWPLVNYGGRTVSDNDIQNSFWAYEVGMRPAVRAYKIIEAFALENGYQMLGDLFNNSHFRNQLYFFGVADDWERADDYFNFVTYSAIGALPPIPSGDKLTFLDTSPPYSDPQGLNAGGFFDAGVSLSLDIDRSGWYEFEILIDSDDPIEFDVIVTNSAEVSFTTLYSAQKIGVVLRTEPIAFYLPDMSVGALEGERTRLRIIVNRTSGAGLITIKPKSYYKAIMIKRAQMGAPINISSCLHSRPFKEFFKDILRMFGAVLLVDSVLKTLTLLPRFINDLGETFPNYLQNKAKSYYLVDENPLPLEMDTQGANTTNEKPFGDFLGVYFSVDEEDGAFKIYKSTSDPNIVNNSVPLYSQEFEMAQIGKERQNFDNYFTPLLNSRFAPKSANVNIYSNNCYFPVIIDEGELLLYENLQPTGAKLPTYKSSPKIGTWYGFLDMTGLDINTNTWSYKPYERPASGGQVVLSLQIPSAFQIYPDHPTYDFLIPNPFNSVFPSLNYVHTNNGAGGNVLGLIDVYQRKYIACIFNDKIIRIRARLRLSDFQNENFRRARLVELQGQTVKCWIIGIENYNPLQSELADFTLCVDYQDLDEFSETNNNSKPVILMFSDLSAAEDGYY